VATGNSAEFGRSAGANVNIAVKSGTRDLHGSTYWYVRNDKFDANEWFANRQNRGKVPFRQNQYGFALGGPVVIPKIYQGRDRTFWFVSWEGFKRRRGNTTQSTVPLAAMHQGDFSMLSQKIYDPLTGALDASGKIIRRPFAGNRIPADRIHPGMKLVAEKLLPFPNRGISERPRHGRAPVRPRHGGEGYVLLPYAGTARGRVRAYRERKVLE
jgi:hypothetical protein